MTSSKITNTYYINLKIRNVFFPIKESDSHCDKKKKKIRIFIRKEILGLTFESGKCVLQERIRLIQLTFPLETLQSPFNLFLGKS